MCEQFLDTQYLNDDEDTVNQERDHSDVTEEDNETELDPQSLGLNSSHNDAEQYEEDDTKTSEMQNVDWVCNLWLLELKAKNLYF